MNLTNIELAFIRNNLLACRAYRNTEVNLDGNPWEPWMEGFLKKITKELTLND